MSEVERHTIACIVDNESGVLARVVGLFSGRGYNIESLTVAVVDSKRGLSRITLLTSGTKMIIEQIKAQLGRLVPMHKVIDLTAEGPHVERELALLKVNGTGEKRVESLRIADIFRARAVDSTTHSFVFEITVCVCGRFGIGNLYMGKCCYSDNSILCFGESQSAVAENSIPLCSS